MKSALKSTKVSSRFFDPSFNGAYVDSNLMKTANGINSIIQRLKPQIDYLMAKFTTTLSIYIIELIKKKFYIINMNNDLIQNIKTFDMPNICTDILNVYCKHNHIQQYEQWRVDFSGSKNIGNLVAKNVKNEIIKKKLAESSDVDSIFNEFLPFIDQVLAKEIKTDAVEEFMLMDALVNKKVELQNVIIKSRSCFSKCKMFNQLKISYQNNDDNTILEKCRRLLHFSKIVLSIVRQSEVAFQSSHISKL